MEESRTFSEWKSLARDFQSEKQADLARFCIASSYFGSDKGNAFYQFCYEVMGFRDVYEPFHLPMTEFLTSTSHRYKMLQAARGTFKSSIAVAAGVTYDILSEIWFTGQSEVRILDA